MNKKHLLKRAILGLALFAGSGIIAQNNRHIQPCNTYAAMEEVFAADPSAKKRYDLAQDQLRKEYLAYEANKSNNKSAAATVYTIPVVFHVLHQGGAENISDAALNAALVQVNKDYSRTSSDTGTIAQPFRSSYINSDMVFMLAKKDPNGNCTSGIVRHFDTKTNWAQANFATNYSYTWDPTKYLNIYIVAQIIPQGTVTGGGIIVGYTYKPGTWPTGASQDAIVYNYQFLSGLDARSLSHEIGHWFNLSHTWGNTNNPGVACGDDGITDTPVTKGEFTGCASSSVSACTQTNAAMTGLNNVENIMNYSSCPKNFTTNQTNAMRSAAASATSLRNNLWSAGNMSATGIGNTTPCAPIADFLSTSGIYTVCSGQSLNFRDYSYNGTVTSYSWSGNNGAVIASPSASLTSITFPNQGIVAITLTVTNAQGSSNITRTVSVLNGVAQITSNYSESFEGSGTPNNWSVVNQNFNSVQWAQTSLAASDQSNSFFIDGTINPANHIDILNMPSMDFNANQGAILTFKYAYRRYSTSNNDVFKVQLSGNCGGTWLDVFSPNANTMASGSGGVGTTAYVPASNEWKYQDVSNHPNYFNFINNSSVLARFYFQEDPNGAGFGNRLYIDEVNFSVPAGVNEITQHLLLNLYPNPTSNSAQLSFVLSNDATVKVSVTDIAGKVVSAEKSYVLNAGNHSISVNENGALNKGIYIINMDYNGTKIARKLIIE